MNDKCENCNGTGSVKNGSGVNLACPVCNGTGTTGPEKEKVVEKAASAE